MVVGSFFVLCGALNASCFDTKTNRVLSYTFLGDIYYCTHIQILIFLVIQNHFWLSEVFTVFLSFVFCCSFNSFSVVNLTAL